MSTESHSFAEPPEERRCASRSADTGERCRRWAARGSTLCGVHGGARRLLAAAGSSVCGERSSRQA